jgi:hypothetical protein
MALADVQEVVLWNADLHRQALGQLGHAAGVLLGLPRRRCSVRPAFDGLVVGQASSGW